MLKKQPTKNVCGNRFSASEQRIYDNVTPMNWDTTYALFADEMRMFENVHRILKTTPEDAMPSLNGVPPELYMPIFRIIERIVDSVHRLEQPVDAVDTSGLTAPPDNDRIMEHAKSLGIDLVGFTELETDWVFPTSDNWTYITKHEPIRYTNVIALGMEMNFETMNVNSFPGLGSLSDVGATYAKLGEAVEKLTDFIRSLGYNARGHHPFTGNFLYSAHAAKAGLGQLGANGLVITREFGPRNRFAAITTDAPLRLTEFRDMGVDKTCDSCMRCIQACPTGALLPFKINWRGTLRWKIDQGRCYKSYIENNACGICLNVCPWNKEDSWHHRATAQAMRWLGPLRKLVLSFDDHYYWKKSPLHPAQGRNIPDSGPMSFKSLLEFFGSENCQQNIEMLLKNGAGEEQCTNG